MDELRRCHLLATTGGHRPVRRRRRTGSIGCSAVDCGGWASPSSVVGGRASASSAGGCAAKRSPPSRATSSPMLVGFFLAACAVLATVRGDVDQQLVVDHRGDDRWPRRSGLAVAVLADRARGENIAKSMIFLPMAISFIGAGIIWRFMYVTRNVDQAPDRCAQRDLGRPRRAEQLRRGRSGSSPRCCWRSSSGCWLWRGRASVRATGTRAGFSIGFALFFGLLTYLLLVPGIGGFVIDRRR